MEALIRNIIRILIKLSPSTKLICVCKEDVGSEAKSCKFEENKYKKRKRQSLIICGSSVRWNEVQKKWGRAELRQSVRRKKAASTLYGVRFAAAEKRGRDESLAGSFALLTIRSFGRGHMIEQQYQFRKFRVFFFFFGSNHEAISVYVWLTLPFFVTEFFPPPLHVSRLLIVSCGDNTIKV